MQKKIVLVKDTSYASADQTNDFASRLNELARQQSESAQTQVVRVADLGIYGQGLVIKIWPDNLIYHHLRNTDIERIIKDTLIGGRVIDDLLYKEKSKQLRIVLRNCGKVDPESLDDYILNGGFVALKKVLTELTPEAVLQELKKSGLRGRGGAGYPTWMKWNITHNVKNAVKYMICNGDEGDPGAYMDRSVLEGDPYSVVEGMIIAGHTIGASKGFFYIRAEYPLAVERIRYAIDRCYQAGWLGQKIQGTDFSYDLDIRLGAGAFVCGEETALISSIEGARGYPRPRPPYPSVKGLWGKPTVINNVETLANVPYILCHGGDAFAKVGTATSKGTKVFAVTGKVKNSGLVEVPMGTTLRQIIYDICGGTISGKEVKAVQTGGPSGGVIPAEQLDIPVDYENLQKLGSIMGSGGMIVMDTDDCMVDIAKFYQQFCVDESCGKCAPCRIGTSQMLNILTNISEGQGKIEDIQTLKKTSIAMQKAALCGLGQSAPNPVVSTIRYFEPEYKEHILDKSCRAGKCSALAHYSILEDKCKRCGVCVRNCPSVAISGDRTAGYRIDQAKCVKCGNCAEACKFNAISKK
jgi:NADP-reducing hydrogenase subunit HndC